MRYSLRCIPFLLLLTLLAACGGTATSSPSSTPTTNAASAVTLNVFAAASLTESFKNMAKQYQQSHPNVKLVFNFAGSQILEQQIANGAPSDVFASADQTNMKKASDAGVVNAAQVFARNRLVVILPVNNPAGITSLKDLAKKGIKIDLEAATVPAGKYSRQVLDNMAKSSDYGTAYQKAVLANVVSEEDNVKAVVQKVQLGEADAGFVYLTDVTAAVKSKLKVLEIPNQFNVIAEYPIATVKNSQHASDAQAFVDYVLSTDGQAVLAKYGFLPKA